jgi:hypothetical protein
MSRQKSGHTSRRPASQVTTAALTRRADTRRSAPIAPTVTAIVTAIEDVRRRIMTDLKRHGVFGKEDLLNEPTVDDTLRFEIARALDGERVQLMVCPHAWDAERVISSLDEWVERWPQHMALYVDVNLYVMN